MQETKKKFLPVLATFISGSGRNSYIYRMSSHFEHFSPNPSHFKMMHLISNKHSNLCKSGDSLFSDTSPAQMILPIPLSAFFLVWDGIPTEDLVRRWSTELEVRERRGHGSKIKKERWPEITCGLSVSHAYRWKRRRISYSLHVLHYS